MDTTSQFGIGQDLYLLAGLLTFSAGAMLVALLSARLFKLDRLTGPLAGRPKLRLACGLAAVALGSIALAVLLGVVPGTALLHGWVSIAAPIAVLGALLTSSMATLPSASNRQVAKASTSEPKSVKAAA